MSSGIGSTFSSAARGAPIGFTGRSPAGLALQPAPRSLLGGWVILAAVPLLWSWFGLALRMP